MKLRRAFAHVFAAVSAGTLGLGTLAVASTPAQAATGTLSATRGVVVDQAYENISWSATVPWSSSSAAFQWCSVEMENVDSRNSVNYAQIDNQGSAQSGTFRFYGYQMESTANFRVFIEGEYCPMTASTPVTIKSASRAGVSAKRVGSYVTVSASSTRFDGYGYVAQRARVSIQQYASGRWTTVKSGSTSSAGTFSVKLHQPTKKNWRVVAAATAVSIGATSASLQR
jgi:hypothetical protein